MTESVNFKPRKVLPQPVTFEAPDGTASRVRLAHNSAYTDTIARKICERLMLGESLISICKDPRMPSKQSVVRWLANPKLPAFREMYYYARRVGAEILIDEIIEIADDTSDDWKETFNKKGESMGFRPDNEAIQRSRVRIDTRKWYASKMVPQLYGERIDVNHELTGDLAELLKSASNKDTAIPKPVNE